MEQPENRLTGFLGWGLECPVRVGAPGSAVVGAEADKTEWLSKARECDGKEF